MRASSQQQMSPCSCTPLHLGNYLVVPVQMGGCVTLLRMLQFDGMCRTHNCDSMQFSVALEHLAVTCLRYLLPCVCSPGEDCWGHPCGCFASGERWCVPHCGECTHSLSGSVSQLHQFLWMPSPLNPYLQIQLCRACVEDGIFLRSNAPMST